MFFDCSFFAEAFCTLNPGRYVRSYVKLSAVEYIPEGKTKQFPCIGYHYHTSIARCTQGRITLSYCKYISKLFTFKFTTMVLVWAFLLWANIWECYNSRIWFTVSSDKSFCYNFGLATCYSFHYFRSNSTNRISPLSLHPERGQSLPFH